MNYLFRGLFSAFIYIFICIITIAFSFNSYAKAIRVGKNERKISMVLVIVVSIVFSFYNKFNSVPQFYGDDRKNYMQDFYGRLTTYSGFDWYLKLMNKVTHGNFELMLYFTTFICCLILLIVYKYSNNSSPYALFFLFSSNFVFFTFVGLKQAIAGIFANLFFLFILAEAPNIITEIMCLATVILACYFHVTGYILVPIYILMKINYKNNKKAISIILLMLLAILFMKQLLLGMADALELVLPNISYKITEYLGEDTIQVTEGTLSVLKGFPYYFITYYALKNRKRYVEKIPDFNRLLVLSFVASILAVSTIVSYWFSRFTFMFLFPVSLLFSNMIQCAKSKVEKHNILILVLIPMLLFTLRSLLLVIVNYGGY